MEFYLGTDNPTWLGRTETPLFVSHIRLRRYKGFPRAKGSWALDSGGFTQLKDHGKWLVSAGEYAEAVMRYRSEIGRLDWASPQDWMCEPWIIDKTGKSIAEHLELTVASYLELTALAPQAPFVPVLQGWELDDYFKCAELYESAGVDLRACNTVGVGSVCRRQSMNDIARIMKALATEGYRLHGFGVKTNGLRKYARHLVSADSMAWSFTARRQKIRLEGCDHETCKHCLKWALVWRDKVLSSIEPSPPVRNFALMAREANTVAARLYWKTRLDEI